MQLSSAWFRGLCWGRLPAEQDALGSGEERVLSSSGLPSSRKMKSYWRESSGGLRG